MPMMLNQKPSTIESSGQRLILNDFKSPEQISQVEMLQKE